jgi:transcriptional regulator with XRE-family HTH domain
MATDRGFVVARDSAAEFFGRALAAARSERGLKRMRLKELSGLSYPYISEIENGGKYPSQRAIQALADALGMSPSELVGRAERIEADEVDARAGDDSYLGGDPWSAPPATGPTSAPSMMPRPAMRPPTSEADQLLIEQLSARVLRSIEKPLRELLAREVQMTVREELLRQRDSR